MKKNKEDDKSSLFSSAKTSASLTNEDSDLFPKSRPRGGGGGIKSKINNFQAGRHTVAVPLNSFSGISHNASFQSKLLFFNAGKTGKKFQHAPVTHDKVITEESEKKENKIKKSAFNKDDKIQKTKNEKNENIDLENNININKIMDSKTNNNSNKNNNNNNNNDNDNTKKMFVKKKTATLTSNKTEFVSSVCLISTASGLSTKFSIIVCKISFIVFTSQFLCIFNKIFYSICWFCTIFDPFFKFFFI